VEAGGLIEEVADSTEAEADSTEAEADSTEAEAGSVEVGADDSLQFSQLTHREPLTVRALG
jgi:hypothetical protein